MAVLTEWKRFKSIDSRGIFAILHKPEYVFDGHKIPSPFDSC